MAIIDWIWVIICPIIAFLIGSIPFSYLITKWRTGKDLRESGNKNVGGLNAMIQSGFNWGFLAGFLDYFKGLICIISVLVIPFDDTIIIGSDYTALSWHNLIYILTCMAVILGHNFTPWLKFRGGRGIAAVVSFFVITNPLLLIIFVICQMILGLITRSVRPAQLISFFIVTPIAFFIPENIFPPWIVIAGLNNPFFLGLFAVGVIAVIIPKYIGPFIAFLKGEEYRIGKTGGLIMKEEKETID